MFHKTVHSSLYAKGQDGATLHDWLRDHDIGEVIVSGIRTEQCCETTSRHASDAGFKVIFPTDATLTFAMQSPSGRHTRPPRSATAPSWCYRAASRGSCVPPTCWRLSMSSR